MNFNFKACIDQPTLLSVIHGAGHGLDVPGDVVDEHCAHHKERAFLR